MHSVPRRVAAPIGISPAQPGQVGVLGGCWMREGGDDILTLISVVLGLHKGERQLLMKVISLPNSHHQAPTRCVTVKPSALG